MAPGAKAPQLMLRPGSFRRSLSNSLRAPSLRAPSDKQPLSSGAEVEIEVIGAHTVEGKRKEGHALQTAAI